MPASKSSLHLQSIKDRQSMLDEDPSLRAATRRVEKKDWSLIARNSSGSSKPQQRPSLTWPADSEICQGLTAFVMYQVSSKHTDDCWLKKKSPHQPFIKMTSPLFCFFSFYSSGSMQMYNSNSKKQIHKRCRLLWWFRFSWVFCRNVQRERNEVRHEVTDVSAATSDQTNGNCCTLAAFCGRGWKIYKTITGPSTATWGRIFKWLSVN